MNRKLSQSLVALLILGFGGSAQAVLMNYAIDAELVDSTGTTVFTGEAGTFSTDLDLVDASGFAPLASFSWNVPFSLDLADVDSAGEFAEAFVGGIGPVGLSVNVSDGANVLQLRTGNSDNSVGLIAWSCSSCPGFGTEFGNFSDPVIEGTGSSYTVRVVDGVVPEPTTLALMGLGLGGVGFSSRKSRKAK